MRDRPIEWTIELESKFKQDKIKLHQENEQYMRQHPELKQMLQYLTTQVLLHKPPNVLEYMSELIKQGPQADLTRDVAKRESIKTEIVNLDDFVTDSGNAPYGSILCLNEIGMTESLATLKAPEPTKQEPVAETVSAEPEPVEQQEEASEQPIEESLEQEQQPIEQSTDDLQQETELERVETEEPEEFVEAEQE